MDTKLAESRASAEAQLEQLSSARGELQRARDALGEACRPPAPSSPPTPPAQHLRPH